MNSLKTILLICPDCSASLTGNSIDRTFFCPEEGKAYDLSSGEVKKICKVKYVKEVKKIEGSLFYLPFYHLEIIPHLNWKSYSKKDIFVPEQIFIAGYLTGKSGYFTDFGIIYTRLNIKLDFIDKKFHLSGCSVSINEASALIEAAFLTIINRQRDIKELSLNFEIKETEILAFPFYLKDDKIFDGITGEKIPKNAVEGIEEIINKVNSK